MGSSKLKMTPHAPVLCIVYVRVRTRTCVRMHVRAYMHFASHDAWGLAFMQIADRESTRECFSCVQKPKKIGFSPLSLLQRVSFTTKFQGCVWGGESAGREGLLNVLLVSSPSRRLLPPSARLSLCVNRIPLVADLNLNCEPIPRAPPTCNGGSCDDRSVGTSAAARGY